MHKTEFTFFNKKIFKNVCLKKRKKKEKGEQMKSCFYYSLSDEDFRFFVVAELASGTNCNKEEAEEIFDAWMRWLRELKYEDVRFLRDLIVEQLNFKINKFNLKLHK